jgi:hypothetical protein
MVRESYKFYALSASANVNFRRSGCFLDLQLY